VEGAASGLFSPEVWVATCFATSLSWMFSEGTELEPEFEVAAVSVFELEVGVLELPEGG